jgi:hypothetical protein
VIVFIPPMKPVPLGASDEDRRRMYEEYCDELRRLNPFYYHSDGSLRRWWQLLLGVRR